LELASGGAGALLWWVVAWHCGGAEAGVRKASGKARWRVGRPAGWQVCSGLEGKQGRGLEGWGPGEVAAWHTGRQAAAYLFFQCIVTWRSLPWARG
jgi:hypothetical protein